MNKTLITLTLAAICGALAACGGGTENAPVDIARADAAKNINWNVHLFQQDRAQYQAHVVNILGDDAIREDCLQGSGVGTATLTKGTDKIVLTCSTGTATGCQIVTAPAQHTCNPNIRWPLPSLGPVQSGH